MKTLCLSGWAQPCDALSPLLPSPASGGRLRGVDAQHFDYQSYSHMAMAMSALRRVGEGCEVLIGWSLGGIVALQAILQGIVVPKALVLIAAPFQFVASAEFPHGMKREDYDAFYAAYVANPGETLGQFHRLMLKGDRRMREILAEEKRNAVSIPPYGAYWLYLLSVLSCRGKDAAALPPALIIHGANDAIIAPAQAEALAEWMPGAQLQLWEGCAHAPHLHDPERLKQTIAEWLAHAG